jgi:hypothetical protein
MAQKQANEFGFIPDAEQNEFGFAPDQKDAQQLSQRQKQMVPKHWWDKQINANIGEQGYLGRSSANILAGAMQGGQAIHNAPYALVNLFSNKAAQKYTPEPTNYDFAQMFGAGQSTPEKVGRDIFAGLPFYIAAPESAAGRIGAGGVAGAAQSPDSPWFGAAVGAGTASIPELPSLAKGAKTLAQYPKGYLKESIQKLGGSENVDDIAKSLSKDIEDKAKEFKQTYEQKLQPVKESMAGKNIYETPNGTLERTYNPLAKGYENLDLGGAEEAHTAFIENPTYENADSLQKALGEEARSIKGIERSSMTEKNKLYKLRNNLKSDIHNSLDTYDPSKNLSDTYKDASAFYKNEYVPYKQIKTLMDVMGEKGATSDSLLNVFEKPKLTSDPEEISNALKVANDLGDAGKDKIMALKLAKIKNVTPKKALSTYENVETSGLNKYVTPTLDQVMKGLSNRMLAKKIGVGGLSLLGLNELRKHFPLGAL